MKLKLLNLVAHFKNKLHTFNAMWVCSKKSYELSVQALP